MKSFSEEGLRERRKQSHYLANMDRESFQSEEGFIKDIDEKRTKAKMKGEYSAVASRVWNFLLALCFTIGVSYVFLFSSPTPRMTQIHPLPRLRNRSLQGFGSQSDQPLYRDLHDKPNPDWKDLKAMLIVGENTLGPAYGSTIKISREEVEVGRFKHRPIMEDVKVHVPVNSLIGRKNFENITRWYQEDSHTQIFRMFTGDDNIRNERQNAPRSEAFIQSGWKRGDGWHEWSGRYTFLKVRNGAVFQLKHNHVYWSLQLCMKAQRDGTYDLIYQTLRDYKGAIVLERDVVGKSFDIQVQDDGFYHRIYIDGRLRIHNQFTNRTDSETNRARWGFYSPGSPINKEILILVTGAQVGKLDGGTENQQLSFWQTFLDSLWSKLKDILRGEQDSLYRS